MEKAGEKSRTDQPVDRFEDDMASRILLALAFVVIVIASWRIHSIERELMVLKGDAAELADVRYGLFNTAIWKEIASESIATRLGEVDLTGDRDTLLPQVESILDSLIDDLEAGFEERMTRGAEPGESAWRVFRHGIRNLILDMAIDFDEIRGRTGSFAETILDHLEKPENQARMKEWIGEQLDSFLQESLAATDMTAPEAIARRHGCVSIEECRSLLEARISEGQQRARPWFILLGIMGVVILVAVVFLRDRTPWSIAFLLATALAFLGVALSVPMLDIDARIAELRLDFLGKEIVFRNQVLFFQSKSLFDVVHLLLRSGDPSLSGVAVLILVFSLLFPGVKSVLSFLWLCAPRLRRNPVIAFFVLRSGKWSMADVMVVAIFMAFIGFDGLIDDQLAELSRLPEAGLIAMNGSAPQPGLYLFTAFCLCGLTAAQLIQNRSGDRHIGR